jgi:hypothetical protein
VNENIFQKNQKILAEKLIQYQDNSTQLANLVQTELWGDAKKNLNLLFEKKDLPLFVLIQKDLNDLNIITPRKLPKWL